MRVHVSHVLTAVGIDYVCSVDWQRLVRVDGHQNNSCDTHRENELNGNSGVFTMTGNDAVNELVELNGDMNSDDSSCLLPQYV